MTDSNKSLVAVVMDRSGSMRSVWDATIEGFNSFLATQKEQPGECVTYYTQFDTVYEIVHNYIPVKDMPDLDRNTYQPRGNTALLDAIGRTIVKVGEDLAVKPENERPANVIFVIQTDGQENASTEYNRDQVKQMIATQRDQFGWTFMFLGAGENAMQESLHMGMDINNVIAYNSNPVSTHNVFYAAGSNVSRTRVGGQAVAGFTPEERTEANK